MPWMRSLQAKKHGFRKRIESLVSNDRIRTSIWVPNGTRLVFYTEGATLAQLSVMQYLLQELLNEIVQGLSRSFKKLAEARVDYSYVVEQCITLRYHWLQI